MAFKFILSMVTATCAVLSIRYIGGIDVPQEECTVDDDKATALLLNLLETFVPIDIVGMNPCNSCTIDGIADATGLNQTVVSFNITFVNQSLIMFEVIFRNVSIDCTCNLSSNPADTVKTLQQIIVAPPAGCSPAAVADGLASSLQDKLIGPTQQDLLKMSACIPVPSVTVTQISGKVKAYWTKLRITFNVIVPPMTSSGNLAVRTVQVDTKNSVDVKTFYESVESGFAKAAQCLLAGGFLQNVIIQAMQIQIPCNVEKQIQNFNVSEYLECSNNSNIN